MKLFALFLILGMGTILSGCKSNPASNAASQQDTSASNKEYYPISGYIKNQLKWLDSVPLAIIKYTTRDHHTDTSIVEKTDFNTIAEDLSLPDISSSILKKQYDEVSFIDASIGTISLTYSATNDTALIRKADVLLDQNSTAVRTIYLEKISRISDSTCTRKILWTANKNCLVTTIIQKPGSPESILEEKYVWDDR